MVRISAIVYLRFLVTFLRLSSGRQDSSLAQMLTLTYYLLSFFIPFARKCLPDAALLNNLTINRTEVADNVVKRHICMHIISEADYHERRLILHIYLAI
jgi:hypothetical protein